MATLSTELVSSGGENPGSPSDFLRYDSILADACAFNRRLRKGRGTRPEFFDSATQIAQRPAPWLHRSVLTRSKSLSLTRSHFFLTYQRHSWRIQPGLGRKFAESLDSSRLLLMFQAISFQNSAVGIDPANPRGSIPRPQGSTGELTKQPQSQQTSQQPQTTLGVTTTDPEASLPGSVSGEGSCQSSATPTSVNNSTTASNGGDRRISTTEMQQQQQQQQQTQPQTQASPSTEDFNGQRYESYASGRYLEDVDDAERSKLKFRRRMLGVADKTAGVVRRYQRRIGTCICGRPRGRRGAPGRCDGTSRWSSTDPTASGMQSFETGFEDESPADPYTPPDEAIYRSNANLSMGALNDGVSSKSSHLHPGMSDMPDIMETTIVPRPETPIGSHNLQHHQHYHHQSHSQGTPAMSNPGSTASSMSLSHYHSQQQAPDMEKRLSQDEWRGGISRHADGSTPGETMNQHQQQQQQPQSQQMSRQQHEVYHGHHGSPMNSPPPPPPQNNHQQHHQQHPPLPPPPLPPQSQTPSQTGVSQVSSTSGSGSDLCSNHGPPGTPTQTVAGGGGSSAEATTVVTFFVCEVCASRYRSTAGLRYHYHSQHAGYTPRNPISASASRVSIPTSEYNRFAPNTGPRGGRNGRNKRSRNNYSNYRTGSNKGRGLSAANQQIVNQRNSAQIGGGGSGGGGVSGGGESDPYHLPSASTPDASHARSVFSSSSEAHHTESSLSSANSSSYISPIKLKSESTDYSGGSGGGSSSGRKPYSGYAPPPPATHSSSGSHGQPAPPPYDQHTSYYGAPSALASMDNMASSLLRQQHHPPPSQQPQQPLHSLLAQLHPSSYKTSSSTGYTDASGQFYPPYQQQRAYAGGKPSFVELKDMLRHRRAQYPAAPFTCGYCQMHVESGAGGSVDQGTYEGEAVSYTRCFGCGMPVHHFCILRYRSGGPGNASRTSNSQRLCYPWVCTECKSCWICGSGINEELIICCSECDRGYHGYCLTGTSPGYQTSCFPDDWVCEICRQQDACIPNQTVAAPLQ